jgi:hypothetical protein
LATSAYLKFAPAKAKLEAVVKAKSAEIAMRRLVLIVVLLFAAEN